MSSTFPLKGTDEGIWGMYKSEGIFLVRALFDSEKTKKKTTTTIIDLKQEGKHLLIELLVQR